MSSPPIGSSFFHCGAAVDSATGNPVVANGCTVVKTAVGVFTLTLEQGIDALEAVATIGFLGPLSIGDIAATLVHTSDTVKTVSIFVGNPGIATDQDFNVTIERIRPGA